MIHTDVLRKGSGFAVYPSVKLKQYKTSIKTGKKRMSFRKELLFGDYIRLLLNQDNQPITLKVGKKTYVRVRARRANGYIEVGEVQPNRVLEVNFVDIGQGDGCHVVTPDDEHLIIDAGKGDNMYRFLSWRFNLRNPKNRPPKMIGVISHCDDDHYYGFSNLFKAKRGTEALFRFDMIYHNGLVEESGRPASSLGTIQEHNGKEYISNLVHTNTQMKERIVGATKKGKYMKMLERTSAPFESVNSTSPAISNSGNYKIEVLGPITEQINGKEVLRVFDNNKGRTKNGHSVILKLKIGHLSLLLGGDLNSSSENYLFEKISGADMVALNHVLKDPEATKATKEKAQKAIEKGIEKTRKVFKVDIAKSCHHGSSDFTHDFLAAINPIATVISSGDNESYCHPRPDTLGTIGKFSRGERSLIFSTELARSTKEFIDVSKFSATKKKERLVTVYGMINVRSDGDNVIIAQKLEKPGASKGWDIHPLVWNKKLGEFEYIYI